MPPGILLLATKTGRILVKERGGHMVRRMTVVLLSGVLIAVGLAGCPTSAVQVTEEDAVGVLVIAANELLYYFEGAAGSVFVARGAGGTVIPPGPDGGTAQFDYDTSTGYYQGTVIFADWSVATDSEHTYVLDGEVLFRVDFDTADVFPITATYVGALALSKNGGEATNLDVDIALTIDLGGSAGLITLEIASAGTINGQSASTDVSVGYAGSAW
jgi:hypothetical protein